MNQPKSLINITEFLYFKQTGRITEREEYWLIESPKNPSYFWGNYLVMKCAPKTGDFDHWMALYAKEFDVEKQGFISFAWDEQEEGEIADFLAQGFETDFMQVLSLNRPILPEKLNEDIEVRAFQTERDWEQFVAVREVKGPFTVGFIESQKDVFRELIAKGVAERYGAFKGDLLVGDLGIVWEQGVLRYNNVSTHPDHRREGVCKTLVNYVSQLVYQQNKFNHIIIVADRGSVAEKIYQSLGYEPSEGGYGVGWYDKERYG